MHMKWIYPVANRTGIEPVSVLNHTRKQDGLCVAECPMVIIRLKDKKSVPTPTKDADELCIHCGHCVAVCPHGAMSHKSMTPEQCPPVRKDWRLNPEQVEHFLRSRRSIRTYRGQPVEREILARQVVSHLRQPRSPTLSGNCH
jgi:Fe-S-cluster-containing hydrogenase component 2